MTFKLFFAIAAINGGFALNCIAITVARYEPKSDQLGPLFLAGAACLMSALAGVLFDLWSTDRMLESARRFAEKYPDPSPQLDALEKKLRRTK